MLHMNARRLLGLGFIVTLPETAPQSVHLGQDITGNCSIHLEWSVQVRSQANCSFQLLHTMVLRLNPFFAQIWIPTLHLLRTQSLAFILITKLLLLNVFSVFWWLLCFECSLNTRISWKSEFLQISWEVFKVKSSLVTAPSQKFLHWTFQCHFIWS